MFLLTVIAHSYICGNFKASIFLFAYSSASSHTAYCLNLIRWCAPATLSVECPQPILTMCAHLLTYAEHLVALDSPRNRKDAEKCRKSTNQPLSLHFPR